MGDLPRNIGLVLVTLINWLLKPKCVLIHIFEFYFCIYIYIYTHTHTHTHTYIYIYESMIYFWETWPYAWKQNFLIFFYVLPKNGYFNTKFVSLHYKNTNRCWLKYSRKISRKSQIFEIFYMYVYIYIYIYICVYIFFLGPARPMWRAGPSHPTQVGWT